MPVITEYTEPLPKMTSHPTARQDVCPAYDDPIDCRWACTREAGHDGNHEAGGGDVKFAEWPAEPDGGA